MAPDDVKIELTQDRSLKLEIATHQIYFFNHDVEKSRLTSSTFIIPLATRRAFLPLGRLPQILRSTSLQYL